MASTLLVVLAAAFLGPCAGHPLTVASLAEALGSIEASAGQSNAADAAPGVARHQLALDTTNEEPLPAVAKVVVSGEGSVVKVPWLVLPIVAAGMAMVIVFIYAPHGPNIVFSVLVYVSALSMMKLSVKWVFVTHHFPHAKFLSGLHFASGALVTGFLLLRRKGGTVPIPTGAEFFLMILPIALSVVLSIGANNMALLTCSAAFTEIVGATNCLITIAMVITMGMPFDMWLIVPALVVAFGCGLATTGEINLSITGMALCLLSNVFRSLKVSLQQKLMTGESKDKFDPCALLFWISLPSVVVMMVLSLATEGLAPYHSLAAPTTSLFGLMVAIIVSCVNATILNLAQLFVTKFLGAVGSQLVAQAKMVLTVLGGMVLFGEPMTQIEVFGFALVLVGVYFFSRMEQASKEKKVNGATENTPLVDVVGKRV